MPKLVHFVTGFQWIKTQLRTSDYQIMHSDQSDNFLQRANGYFCTQSNAYNEKRTDLSYYNKQLPHRELLATVLGTSII